MEKTTTSVSTLRVASWLASVRYEDLPPAVIEKARLLLMDAVGVTLGGRKEPGVQMLLRSITTSMDPAAVPIFGNGCGSDALGASLVNGTMSHVLDYDDTLLPSRVHISGGLAAGLLALGQEDDRSGRDLLVGMVAGFELGARIADEVNPDSWEAGYHSVGLVTPFSVAAGGGAMLGSEPEAIARSIGIAASQSAGLLAQRGTMTKSFHMGHGAHAGVLSVLLSRQGFTATPRALDDDGGRYLRQHAPPRDVAFDTTLGNTWRILDDGFKAFACGIVAHAAIDGALILRKRLTIDARDIEAIRVTVAPRTLEIMGDSAPAAGLETKFSLPYAVAAALVVGHGGPSIFEPETASDPDIVSLMSRTIASADPKLRQEQALVQISLGNESHEQWVESALGTAGNPMGENDVVAKFRHLVDPALGEETAGVLQTLLLDLEGSSARALTDLCRGAQASP